MCMLPSERTSPAFCFILKAWQIYCCFDGTYHLENKPFIIILIIIIIIIFHHVF